MFYINCVLLYFIDRYGDNVILCCLTLNKICSKGGIYILYLCKALFIAVITIKQENKFIYMNKYFTKRTLLQTTQILRSLLKYSKHCSYIQEV